MKTALAYATLALAILAAFAFALAVIKRPADGGLKGKAEERRNHLEEAAKQLSR
jgi:hypothetical protein